MSTYVFKNSEHFSKALVLRPAKRKKRRFPLNLLPQKGDTFFEALRKTVFLVSILAAVVCLTFAAQYFIENHRNKIRNQRLESIYMEAEYAENSQNSNNLSGGFGTAQYSGRLEENKGASFISPLPGARKLLSINGDVVGYFSIPGTEIQYPLMQAEKNNDKYLHTDLYGNRLRAGSIFLDFRNNFDRVENGKTAAKNSDVLIVYGHNMRDGSMFGDLKNYKNQDSFYQKHPIIDLNSNYSKYKYKIFGFFIADPDKKSKTFFDYWNKLNFKNEDEFYEFVNEIKRRTLRNTNVDVKYGDKLLLLSTCTNTIGNGRFVVAARLCRDGEDLKSGTLKSSKNENPKMPAAYYRQGKSSYDEKKFVPYKKTK